MKSPKQCCEKKYSKLKKIAWNVSGGSRRVQNWIRPFSGTARNGKKRHGKNEIRHGTERHGTSLTFGTGHATWYQSPLPRLWYEDIPKIYARPLPRVYEIFCLPLSSQPRLNLLSAPAPHLLGAGSGALRRLSLTGIFSLYFRDPS